MQKAVVTVEALRCHECQMLIDPVDGAYVRRRIRTAVEVGHRYGPIERYELANLCTACDEKLTAKWMAEREAGGQSMQSLGRLFLAGVLMLTLHYMGWPVAIAMLVTGVLFWRRILGRSILGMILAKMTLEPLIGEAALAAWATPMVLVVMGVMLATTYGWNASPQRNLPAEGEPRSTAMVGETDGGRRQRSDS